MTIEWEFFHSKQVDISDETKLSQRLPAVSIRKICVMISVNLSHSVINASKWILSSPSPVLSYIPSQRRLVTISVECAFNYRAPYAMYCFCWLSGLTWVAWACTAAYGKCALIRIGDQPPLIPSQFSQKSGIKWGLYLNVMCFRLDPNLILHCRLELIRLGHFLSYRRGTSMLLP